MSNQHEYPYLLTRYKALLIDALVLFGGFAITMIIVQDVAFRPYAGGIYLIVAFLYEPVMLITLSATIGHQMVGIKVVRFDDPERRINLLSGIIRNIMKFSLGWMSFITINLNDEHRAIHDFASSSLVVNKK